VSSAIPDLLSQVEHLVSRRVEAALGPDGPTLDQWRVLAHLADGAVHPMSEIAARAMVPAPTLTKIRRVLVFLSDHGRAEHARLAPAVATVGESLTAELGADAGLLAALLERVREL
jgi:DNA-binding MarR family transcriptional regulator